MLSIHMSNEQAEDVVTASAKLTARGWEIPDWALLILAITQRKKRYMCPTHIMAERPDNQN